MINDIKWGHIYGDWGLTRCIAQVPPPLLFSFGLANPPTVDMRSVCCPLFPIVHHLLYCQLLCMSKLFIIFRHEDVDDGQRLTLKIHCSLTNSTANETFQLQILPSIVAVFEGAITFQVKDILLGPQHSFQRP